MKRLILFIFLALSPLLPACAFVFFDDDFFDIPNDFIFIQDALDFSNPGDTVTVDCGYYSPSQTGDLFPLFVPSGVNLQGASADCVTLDAENTGALLNITNYDGGIVSGFTFLNGFATNGGGVFLSNVSNLTLQDNIFQGNQASNLGSGLWMINGGPGVVIQNNLFEGNIRASSAAGVPASVQFSNSQVSFFNNVIAFGDGDGLQQGNNSTGTFENNIFYKNGSGGVGFGFNDGSPSTATVVAYNLFFGNVQNDISVGGNSVTAAEANALTGTDSFSNNFTADPLFANPTVGGDYHLQSASPAANAGDPGPQFNNLNGSRNDIGVFGGPMPLF